MPSAALRRVASSLAARGRGFRVAASASGGLTGLYAAAAAGAVAAAGAWGSVRTEERSRGYEPPPRLPVKFGSVRQGQKGDAEELVWAVKTLEPEKVRQVLQRWPHGAELTDADGNTLFHLAAQERERCNARPADAGEVVQLLLKDGWAVVDQKNEDGVRADVAADRLGGGVASTLLHSRSRDYTEKLRSEESLSLIRDVSPVPWQWDYPVQDEQRRSFAGVLKRAFSEEKCKEWMEEICTKAPWMQLPGVPRKTAWFVSSDCSDCPYRYSGLEYPATVFPPFMEEIRSEVCRLCGIPPEDYPNCCNVNTYEDHSQEVGWHSDDEVMFQGLAGDTRIVSFSLGTARDFCWRLQGTEQTLGSASLGDGDIMTMEGHFQKHYKHSVPRSDSACGKRINFTFRWIKVKAHALDAGTKAVKA
eukprot:TRINITY_DN39058_c0_g1_i1.p1 TRINITY_DN39058_c0_g1~~TRINITY_DN39058_c0_g1_i1.p1  ORF type:complete len:447 (+),score=98.55 TRINITY_DN39058_c0_g1_i1:90-1343(+)